MTTVEAVGSNVVIKTDSIHTKEAIWGWADWRSRPELYGRAVNPGQSGQLRQEWVWTLGPACTRYLLEKLPEGRLHNQLRGPATRAAEAQFEPTDCFILVEHKLHGSIRYYFPNESVARQAYDSMVRGSNSTMYALDLYLDGERRGGHMPTGGPGRETIFWLREERIEVL